MLKLFVQFLIAALIGAIAGNLFVSSLHADVAKELLKALANVVAISSSILGFSISWLSHSKTAIKGICYDAADDLFAKLAELQTLMLWRWGIGLGSSFAAVLITAFLSDPAKTYSWAIPTATALLTPALLFVFALFAEMIRASRLKHQLDEHERNELRKQHNLPDKD